MKQTVLFRTFLALACSAFSTYAQNPSLFSPQRLSLQLGSAYHFNPWGNYNNALATVSQEIRLNRFYIEPIGYYEKINGDLSARGTLGYHLPEISPRLFLLLDGQYASLNAGFEFYPHPGKIPEQFISPAFHQEINFRFWSAGAGLLYQLPLAGKWSVQASAGVDRYSANLDLQWRYWPWTQGPLPVGEGEQLSATLEDASWGGQARLLLSWKQFGPVSLLAGAEYRFAKFKSFEGPATYIFSRERTFVAELVEASNYFGVRVKEQPVQQNDMIYLSPLTFQTLPDENSRIPATIDLSGLGLTLGLQMEF